LVRHNSTHFPFVRGILFRLATASVQLTLFFGRTLSGQAIALKTFFFLECLPRASGSLLLLAFKRVVSGTLALFNQFAAKLRLTFGLGDSGRIDTIRLSSGVFLPKPIVTCRPVLQPAAVMTLVVALTAGHLFVKTFVLKSESVFSRRNLCGLSGKRVVDSSIGVQLLTSANRCIVRRIITKIFDVDVS